MLINEYESKQMLGQAGINVVTTELAASKTGALSISQRLGYPIALKKMIKEIKAYPLLKGFRGPEPVDIPFLEQTILKVAHLVEQKPQIKELDLNPVFAYSNGAIAVDARIVMED